jgi:hypothetical protein
MYAYDDVLRASNAAVTDQYAKLKAGIDARILGKSVARDVTAAAPCLYIVV